MKSALVTGGCGFLGSSIVKELLGRGVQVRVLALLGEKTDNIEGLDVEVTRGDVLDIETAKRAVAGVDTVFHAAAIYKGFVLDPTQMYDVNHRGTFNVLEAARRAGTARIVYTASIVSLGRPEEGSLGDEQSPYDAWDLDFPYSRSKYHSRVLAEDFAAWGLDVRVVCPGVILGPGDIAPTPSGKLVINVLKTRSAPYTSGGSSYVDVRDVARAHVLAAEKGAIGERYIATAHNLTNREFLATIARVAGIEPRLLKIPLVVARAAVRAADRRARQKGVEPLISKEMFEYSTKAAFYENRKVRSKLGATFRPMDETVRDAIDYFRQRGLVPRAGSSFPSSS